MRLKAIKLAGFKSFVDQTTVTLPGNRCAVVGPNGCGKSNIIDAVRWVMGESSAKQLRGESLTDVIFNGSNARKPTAMASIELFFDNSDGRIGGEYSAYAEIAIRRQVSRDGQSQYFLNGSKCRRRDIQDIFLGTGFGPRSYSIIEQGMISQLVEAKPEELRVYLEEAAGISKYKERRRETENRIRHTRENLERINDIREELDRQLDRLQRQSQAAAKYRELRAEESLMTAQLFALRYAALAVELKARETKIAELEIALEREVAEQRSLESDIEQQRAAHAELSNEFGSVQGNFYELGAEVARIEESIQFSQTRIKQLEEDLTSVQQRHAETDRQLSMDENQIGDLETQINELLPKVQVLYEEDREAQSSLETIEAGYREWQGQWDEFNTEAAAQDREAEVLSSRMEHLEQLLQRLRRRRDELENLSAQTPEAGSYRVDELAEEISALEGQSRLLDVSVGECITELGAAREDVLARERVLDDARHEVQGLRHELATLEAQQEAALAEQGREAETWINEAGLSDAARLGETLAVVPGWERAVEKALGRFLSALRVTSIDDHAHALAALDEGEISLVEPGSSTGFAVNHALGLPTLESLVRDQSGGTGSLLVGIYAAHSTEAALSKRVELRAGESILTREGVWVGTDWIRVLHDHESQLGIIERGQEIETLTVRVEEAERTLGELTSHVQAGRERVEAVEARREELQRSINTLNSDLGRRRTDHGVTRVKLEEADARREQLAKERGDIDEQIASEAAHLDQTRAGLGAVESARETAQTRREALTEARSDLEARLEQARASARSSRDRYHELNVQKEALQTRLTASQAARERLLNQRTQLDQQRQSLKNGIESNQLPLPQQEANLKEKLERRVEVERALSTLRDSIEAKEAEIRSREGARAECEQKVTAVRESLEGERVDRQGLAVSESNILEQLAATGHELADVQAALPEEAEAEAWATQLEKLQRRIARLGPINLAAIEEYEQESERKTYLDAQAEDLESALSTLVDAIQKIDKETRSRFKETFEAVNTRLGELFPKVFGGGHAYLELTGEDLLDTGVSLMARPPGKRNSSIHLLSGGEKAMTAVALIFAIFHLNPSPVCLLDEVDAPLDDANVSRFAALIEEMSADVQFLVITHNKITMEMADYLMGVTMQEAGVSRLVSVDVDEAAAMAVS